MNMSYQELWDTIKDKLSRTYDESTFNQTFGDVDEVIRYDNNIIYVLVPSLYIQSLINKLYIDKINDLVKKYTDEKLKFKFVIENEIQKDIIPNQNKKSRLFVNNLNQNFNFESFVVGDSNRFGYLTSTKVAESPGAFINPLYIFGGVGLGKTHLMQAIGNYILDKDINAKVLYIQANDFIVDYSKATQTKTMDAFDEKYGNLDCLLVDDIQMLSKAAQSQQEFFKRFNDLINQKKQIVITSDCPADQLSGIMDRLTSRFSQGMIVDIKHPDLEQRIDILDRKAKELTPKKVPREVLYFIAENFTNNVRELEGALNRVIQESNIFNYDDITIEKASKSLEPLLKSKRAIGEKKDELNYENVLSIIASFYNISVSDIISTQRKQIYVLPRHIAMYILKNHLKLPYTRIGKILGGRDHTTIMNGCMKVEQEIKTDKDLKLAIETIIKKVN